MFFISGITDIGIRRSVNQDSVYIAQMETSLGEAVFACICDGMGGLKHGEIASSTVVNAFRQWVHNNLKYLTSGEINQKTIIEHWTNIVNEQNCKIAEYGRKESISLGTTLVAVLIINNSFFAINIGDSRLYEISEGIRQITKDHTLVQADIDAGRITKQEALESKNSHILTRCIGVEESVTADFYFGNVRRNSVYMLCSDGLRHKITEEEIFNYLEPASIITEAELQKRGELLIELNKKRLEKDNISIAMVASK